MTQSLPLLIETKRFTIPAALIPKLRELQEQSKQHFTDKIAESENAVVMTLGMGVAMYLTLDGRVIIDEDDLWLDKPMPPREAKDEKEMLAAVNIGAKIRKTPELLSLLPERPIEALDCKSCEGKGWKKFTETFEFICMECGGVGWVTNN